MTYAVLFPGQGSQAVGMCPDVRQARPDLLGEKANAVLGWDLDHLIDLGPKESLTATQHAQPALYAVSYALFDEFMQVARTPPSAAAGHSLGEYTALAAAGSLDFFEGLALVAERGKAMAECASRSLSGMAALLGADEPTAERIAADRRSDGGALYVANLNAPGQVVVAGASDDIQWLVDNARDLGVRRTIPLDVAGAFHSPFMADATHALDTALDATAFAPPRFPVWSNVTAEPSNDPAGALAAQLTAPVRFEQTLVNLAADGVDTFIHIGPGDVIAGLAKRTVPDCETKVVSSIAQARIVADELSVQ